jgi:acetyl-CoA decarbonylase/synthase complex subunit delta
VVIGGAKALPFLSFEGLLSQRPQVAAEVRIVNPAGEWPEPLATAWGEVMGDPAQWARAAEAAGADLIVLQLTTTDSAGATMTASVVRAALRSVLKATGLPVIVLGTGQAELDNELLLAAAEEGAGEKLVLGPCEDKNYRTVVAAALANGHLVTSKTPMDVNLAKQLTILIHDMGLPLERIIMDPTTGALGYGIEYGYSVMERLRLSALQGDSMTQQPMIVTPGEEAWRTKEARASEGVPESWGDWADRAVNWEALTAAALIESGADIVVLRHPETIMRVKKMIAALTPAEA